MVQRPARNNAGEAMSLFSSCYTAAAYFLFFSFAPPQRESRVRQEKVCEYRDEGEEIVRWSGVREGERGIMNFPGLWMR